MKRLSTLIATAAALLMLAALPAFAQHGHGAPMLSHGPSATHGMSANQSRSNSAHGSAANLSGKSASDMLVSNTKLASKLEKLLPGMTGDSASNLTLLQADAQGFKNLGQFVAAVHVSNNLGIPFDQLKAKMTGDPLESLGKAIQQLKPSANAKVEANKAKDQANNDLNESTQGS